MNRSSHREVTSGSGTFVRISLLLAPSVFGLVCVLFDGVDRGGAWWLLAELAAIPAFLGLVAAIGTVVVQGVRRRIEGGFLVAACAEIFVVGGAWIYSTRFLRNEPWFL